MITNFEFEKSKLEVYRTKADKYKLINFKKRKKTSKIKQNN